MSETKDLGFWLKEKLKIPLCIKKHRYKSAGCSKKEVASSTIQIYYLLIYRS